MVTVIDPKMFSSEEIIDRKYGLVFAEKSRIGHYSDVLSTKKGTPFKNAKRVKLPKNTKTSIAESKRFWGYQVGVGGHLLPHGIRSGCLAFRPSACRMVGAGRAAPASRRGRTCGTARNMGRSSYYVALMESSLYQ